jgi:hypothetical protein
MHPPTDSILISICAALAAMIIETTYRESLLAGPVIGLIVVPAACLVGAGLSLMNADIVISGVRRFSIDLAFIVAFASCRSCNEATAAPSSVAARLNKPFDLLRTFQTRLRLRVKRAEARRKGIENEIRTLQRSLKQSQTPMQPVFPKPDAGRKTQNAPVPVGFPI